MGSQTAGHDWASFTFTTRQGFLLCRQTLNYLHIEFYWLSLWKENTFVFNCCGCNNIDQRRVAYTSGIEFLKNLGAWSLKSRCWQGWPSEASVLGLWMAAISPGLSFWVTVSFVVVQSLSCGQLFVTPWTVARRAPLSMGFSRQEHWSGLPFPSPGHVLDLGTEPVSPELQVGSLPLRVSS